MSNHYGVKQVILMRTDLRNTQGQKVRSGKLMAQAAHAAMIWLAKRVQPDLMVYHGLSDDEKLWLEGSFAKIVLAVGSEEELLRLVDESRRRYDLNAEVCTDNGTTEFGGVPTVTCAAIGPAASNLIDLITGHLKPL